MVEAAQTSKLTEDEIERQLDSSEATVGRRFRIAIANRRFQLPAVSEEIAADSRLTPEDRDLFVTLCRTGLPSMEPLARLVLRINNEPYNLSDHMVFEPLFRTRMAMRLLYITGRQTAKSTSSGAQSVLRSASIPNFNTLHLTPLFEQVRRFSSNYVAPFIDSSPIKKALRTKDTGSVLQRTFNNGSTLYFSYAMYDADRTRGIPAHVLSVDEVQDTYAEVLDIVSKTLGGAMSWHQEQHFGTPKGRDNTIHQRWLKSSQAEWYIQCKRGGCNYWNVPSLEGDIIKMLGPWRRDICRSEPGLVCAKCRKPLSPRHGQYYHAFPERRYENEGYHVPQPVLPHHAEEPDAWADIKRAENGDQAAFFNEVLGESCDVGSKVLTEAELRRACCLGWPRRSEPAVLASKKYATRILAVDWGGGGGTTVKQRSRPSRVSYTTMALLGTNGGGRIDVLWGHRSQATNDKLYEARVVCEVYRKFRCGHLVHDLGGEGGAREALLVAAGLTDARMWPCRYHGPTRALLRINPSSEEYPRPWIGLDKSRTLGITCEAIRHGLIRFFDFDGDDDVYGVMTDFLALFEERMTSLPLNDVYRIDSIPTTPDDFAQAVNIGASVGWHLTGAWPDFKLGTRYAVPDGLLADADGSAVPVFDWSKH